MDTFTFQPIRSVVVFVVFFWFVLFICFNIRFFIEFYDYVISITGCWGFGYTVSNVITCFVSNSFSFCFFLFFFFFPCDLSYDFLLISLEYNAYRAVISNLSNIFKLLPSKSMQSKWRKMFSSGAPEIRFHRQKGKY